MKKIIYLLIISYGVIFLILYNDYSSLVVLITAALLPLCLKLVTTTLRKNTEVRVKVAYPFAEQGQDVETRFHISNQSYFLPITNGLIYLEYKNIFTGERKKKRIPFHVKAGDEVQLTVKWKAKNCGRMKVWIRSVRVYDYFGVFYSKLRLSKGQKRKKSWEKDVIVMPGFLELLMDPKIGEFEEEGESNLYSKHKRGEDPSEIFSIREYKEGDKLHRIHWNLSYKRNQYMVKEYSLPLVCAVTILLDFTITEKGNRRYDYVDAMLKMAFSLSFAYAQMNLLHYIVWYDKAVNEPTRRLIELEEEIHETFHEILTTNLFTEGEECRNGYSKKYGGERQSVIYYISMKENAMEERDLLEQLSCKRVEWIRITEDGKKERERELKALAPVKVREFGIGRLNEDVREWLLSEGR